MNFISDTIAKLPIEIVLPLSVFLLSLPTIRVIVDLRNSNRSHNRELLQQIVHHLEKYSQDQNKVSAFFIQEAARSRYGTTLLLSEILYFLEKSGTSYNLNDYAKHKPYVTIQEGEICLLKPASAICKINMLNYSWGELKGYLSYFVYAFLSIYLVIAIPLPALVWTVVKWLLSIFFIGMAVNHLVNTFNTRDARRYVEELRDNQDH